MTKALQGQTQCFENSIETLKKNLKFTKSQLKCSNPIKNYQKHKRTFETGHYLSKCEQYTKQQHKNTKLKKVDTQWLIFNWQECVTHFIPIMATGSADQISAGSRRQPEAVQAATRGHLPALEMLGLPVNRSKISFFIGREESSSNIIPI